MTGTDRSKSWWQGSDGQWYPPPGDYQSQTLEVADDDAIGNEEEQFSDFENEDEDERPSDLDGIVLESFETDNPYLNRIFEEINKLRIPTKAVNLFLRVSPDDDELLVAALPCSNGGVRRGFLLATTEYLRWAQSFPTDFDRFTTYDYPITYKKIDLGKGLITTADGWQYQTHYSISGSAKAFYNIYQLMQQSIGWNQSKGPQPSDPPQSNEPAYVTSPDLPAQLERLSKLFESGLLDEDEFKAAKRQIIGEAT